MDPTASVQCVNENSEAEEHSEPLVAGLRLYTCEDIRVAHEIYEVTKGVKARIEKLRDKMQSTADGVMGDKLSAH